MPFARRSEPISPRVWARLATPARQVERGGRGIAGDRGTGIDRAVDRANGTGIDNGFGADLEEDLRDDLRVALEEDVGEDIGDLGEPSSDIDDGDGDRGYARTRTEWGSGGGVRLALGQGEGPTPTRSGGRVRVEVPATLRTGLWVPSRRSVLGLAVLAFVVSALFGARVVWALAHEEVTPLTTAGPRASPTTSAPSADALVRGSSAPSNSSSSGPGRGGRVVVHVVGAVTRAGLVDLPAGARVAEAIDAAGGATSEADLSLINVARLLVDGEQIRVPRPGEVVTTGGSGPGATGAGPPGVGSSNPGSQSSLGPGGGRLVSLNSADLTALDALPGVGPVLAQRIIDWRTAHGRFTSVDELGEVTGIGGKLLAQLTPLVTL